MANRPETTTYALFMNARSRKGRKCFERAVQALQQAPDGELVMAKEVRRSGQFGPALAEILERKPDVLVIGGGDGTVSSIAGRLVATDIIAALLPMGTTNNFARSIHIPLDFEAALQVAVNGQDKQFDVAKADNKYFVNVASLGLSATIARRVSNRAKKLLGRAAYGLTGLQELVLHRAVRCEIEAGKRRYDFMTHQLIVANGRYHSAVKISESGRADDGKLIVFSMDKGSRRQLVQNFVRFNLEGIQNLEGSEMIRSSSIRLTTFPRRRLEIDGESGPRTPVTITCLPRAVTFRVPADEA